MKTRQHLRHCRGSRRKLSIQSLERRALLAGDVLAVVDDGKLIIAGDAESNQIAVDQIDLAAGEIRISGLDGTTINGVAEPFFARGVTGDVEADLDDGDDAVIFDQVVVDGDLKIDMGDGFFQVTLLVDVGGDVKFSSDVSFAEDLSTVPSLAIEDSTIAGDLEIKHKEGTTFIEIISTSVAGDIQVDRGQGGDVDDGSLSIKYAGNFFARDLDLGGDLNIKGKDGWDLARLLNSTIGGDVKLDFGDGGLYSDSETPSESFLGSWTTLFGVDIAGDLEVKNKDGFDFLEMFDVNVGDDLKVDNGKGGTNELAIFGDNDGSVTILDDVTVGGDLDIKTKDGSDLVELGLVSVDGKTKIKTGKDDDEVRVFESVFAKFSADGGKDDDLFEDGGGNDFGDGPDLKKFEIIIEDEEEPEPS